MRIKLQFRFNRVLICFCIQTEKQKERDRQKGIESSAQGLNPSMVEIYVQTWIHLDFSKLSNSDIEKIIRGLCEE